MQNDCEPKVCNDIKVLNSVPAINYQVGVMIFGSNRSPRRRDVFCVCGLFIPKNIEMSSSSILKSSGGFQGKQASKQVGKQASR